MLSLHWASLAHSLVVTMEKMSRCSLALLVVLCSMLSVKANYTLEILMLSYRNPQHLALANLNFRHGCCENDAATPCEACDNAFRVCIRETPNMDNVGNCDFGGEMVSSKLEEDNDDLMFTIGESVGGLSNPIIVSGEMWPGTLEVVFNIYDLDTTTSIGSTSDVVDNIFIYPEIEAVSSANGSFSDPVSYIGNANISHLELAFRLICGTDYYGTDCIYCVPTNDSTGHYTCAPVTGEKVCLDGYQGPNCTDCTPAQNCSSKGGYCIVPGDCICKTGYGGDNCELNTIIISTPSRSKSYTDSFTPEVNIQPSSKVNFTFHSKNALVVFHIHQVYSYSSIMMVSSPSILEVNFQPSSEVYTSTMIGSSSSYAPEVDLQTSSNVYSDTSSISSTPEVNLQPSSKVYTDTPSVMVSSSFTPGVNLQPPSKVDSYTYSASYTPEVNLQSLSKVYADTITRVMVSPSLTLQSPEDITGGLGEAIVIAVVFLLLILVVLVVLIGLGLIAKMRDRALYKYGRRP